ncbi:MAG TPA: DUF6328 family protein [Pseudonocardiaceae bacterium]|jgi:hypothetical protein|nr:DUF6328 family protein [Pseudonocardiaceae bacterium]
MTDGLFIDRTTTPDKAERDRHFEGPAWSTSPTGLATGRDADNDRWNYLARGETPSQRLDRNFSELLQEVRVAQVGVQLLLTFLFAAAFTPRFAVFSSAQRGMYIAALVLGAGSTALLMAPASFHRMVFRLRLKRELVLVSNRLVFFGLVLLVLALAAAILLVTDVTMGTTSAVWVTAGVVCWFGLWWYVLPLRCRLRQPLRELPGPRDPASGSSGRP